MKEKWIFTTVALSVLILFYASPLFAAEIDVATSRNKGLPTCLQKQASIVNTRVARIAGVDKEGNTCWGSCRFVLDGGGNILNGTYVDCSGQKARIVGGKLSISDNCEIQGTIVTKLDTLQIARGAVVDNEVVLGLEDKDKPMLRTPEE